MNPLTNVDVDPEHPLVIIVDTMGSSNSRSQLSSLGRGILMYSHYVAPDLNLRLGVLGSVILPLVTVASDHWKASFMVYEYQSVVIYGPVSLGNTSTLAECYRLFKSLSMIFAVAAQGWQKWWDWALANSNL
ncbi:hypothetical protein GGS20DRAFT_564155 [Poronia punctata]|nr:hypothetical protein GGS20DRAFT_564155 [Poronia punctata]